MSFGNVKRLHVYHDYRRQISRSLPVWDGASSSELNLKELQYLPPHDVGNAFNAFIAARQRAGRSVTSDLDFFGDKF
jgi:hypothetical protein